MKDRFING